MIFRSNLQKRSSLLEEAQLELKWRGKSKLIFLIKT